MTDEKLIPAIDPTNFEKPIVSFGKQVYTPISSSTYNYVEILLSHFEFITDVGYLFEKLESTKLANYLNSRQVLSLFSDKVVQIDIKLDKIKKVYNRNYDKLTHVLASMGGIIEALMLFCKFFVHPFIELSFRLNLANTIFTFKTDKNAKNLIKKVKKLSNFKTANYGKEHARPNEFMGILETKNTTSDVKRMEFSKTPTTQIRISYFRYFLNCLSNKSSRTAKKLLDQSLTHIDEIMDISYIMKKLVEIDILKLLLLTEEQNNLFNCLPKPELSVGSRMKDIPANIANASKLTYSLIKKPTDTSKVKGSFDSLMTKDIKTPVDKKLINILNSSFNKKRSKSQSVSPTRKVEDKYRIENNRWLELLKNVGLGNIDTAQKIILFDDDKSEEIQMQAHQS